MILPPQTLAIIHDCTCVSPADLESFSGALGTAFREHFDPIWGTQTTVMFVAPGETPPPRAWFIYVQDEPPAAEAADLGFHTNTGQPVAYVFAKAAIDGGYPWSVPLSHEAFEMRGNPNTDTTDPMTRDGVAGMTMQETCDACQDPRWGVQVAGADGRMWLVSAILCPAWFDPSGEAPYSYPVIPQIDAAGKMASGGYVAFKPDGGQWTQAFAETVGPLQKPHVGSRFSRIVARDALSAMGGAA